MGVKIGIYNLYISARGGGEKRSLVLADHFSRTHKVFLIVPKRPDLLSLERYFDVDLSRVNVVALDESQFARIVAAARKDLGNGPTRSLSREERQVELAPYAALAALAPLGFLLYRRNL